MDVSEIVDRDSFQAWLEELPEERRYEWSVALATRAALRAFPLWMAQMPMEWARRGDLTALTLSRRMLISGVAAKIPTADIKAAASAVAYGAMAEASAYAASAIAVASAASTAADAASIAADAALSSFSASAYWAVLRADCRALLTAEGIQHRPLWPEGPVPDSLQQAWSTGRTWMETAPGHAFWIRWYEAVLAGRPLTGDWDSHWQLMHDIALIDTEDWGKGKE